MAGTIDYNAMAQAYADQYRQQVAQQQQAMLNQLTASKASTNAKYDSNAAAAYLNRMKQENALPEQLRTRGINGGASETAMTNIYNNYALGQSNNSASRAAAIGQLQNTYDTNIANMNAEMERAIAENNNAMAQKQAEYQDMLNQRALEQFSATIERFTDPKKIDQAIKNLDPNDPNYQSMVWLLQLRKAQLKAGKSGGGSGGGGGSRRSGGSSGGGSSSSGTSNSKSSGNSSLNKGTSAVTSIASGAKGKGSKQAAVRANLKNYMGGKSYKKGGGLLQR